MIISHPSSVPSMTEITVIGSSRFSAQIAYIRSRKYLYLTVCTGNLLALSVGFSFAWSSPALMKLTDKGQIHNNPLERTLTNWEISWIGSLLSFGGVFGTFVAIYTAVKFGRKKSLLISCAIPFLLSFFIISQAKHIMWFYVARVIKGVGVSSVYTVVPIYLGEIAEDDIRGFVCASMIIFETAGELVTFCTLPYISIFYFSLMVIGITALAVIIIVILLPESPFYLLAVGNRRAAEKSLMALRSDTEEGVKSELEFIEQVVQEAVKNKTSILDLLKTKASRRAEGITLGLMVFQHCSGIIPISMFSQNIFKESNSSLSPEACTMIIGAVQFLSSFAAPNFVDRLGRRWMLFISSVGMLSMEMPLGFYFFFENEGYAVEQFRWTPIVCLISFIAFYLIGFGPLIWTIMGEIFPPHLKASAFLVGVCFWWMLAFLMTKLFYPIQRYIGMAGCFWLFGGNCFLSTLFIFTYVIETRGKSITEIQMLLSA